MDNQIRLYLDENVQVTVAEQLKRRQIEIVTVRDLGALGDADKTHLERATEMGYVLCTYDQDFLRLASTGAEHTGIVFGKRQQHFIGDWVRGLTKLHAQKTPEQMKNRIEYLSLLIGSN